MLPALSGYEVVRRLRAEDNWVPVLMVSAKDGAYDQADGLDYGADDYLTKPFSYVVLLRPAAGAAAPAERPAAGGAEPRRRRARPGDPRGHRWPGSRSPEPRASTPPRVPPAPPRPGRHQDRAARPGLGRRGGGTSPTPSRCTSATCGASSGAGLSRPCGAPATGSPDEHLARRRRWAGGAAGRSGPG